MRIIRRRRGPHGGNAYHVLVAATNGDAIPARGSQLVLEDMGWLAVDVLRPVRGSVPGLQRGERPYAMEVRTLEPVGSLEDIG